MSDQLSLPYVNSIVTNCQDGRNETKDNRSYLVLLNTMEYGSICIYESNRTSVTESTNRAVSAGGYLRVTNDIMVKIDTTGNIIQVVFRDGDIYAITPVELHLCKLMVGATIARTNAREAQKAKDAKAMKKWIKNRRLIKCGESIMLSRATGIDPSTVKWAPHATARFFTSTDVRKVDAQVYPEPINETPRRRYKPESLRSTTDTSQMWTQLLG